MDSSALLFWSGFIIGAGAGSFGVGLAVKVYLANFWQSMREAGHVYPAGPDGLETYVLRYKPGKGPESPVFWY